MLTNTYIKERELVCRSINFYEAHSTCVALAALCPIQHEPIRETLGGDLHKAGQQGETESLKQTVRIKLQALDSNKELR